MSQKSTSFSALGDMNNQEQFNKINRLNRQLDKSQSSSNER